MGERRSLTEGLTAAADVPPVDPAVAREFVHGKNGVKAQLGQSEPREQPMTLPITASASLTRVPISTRMRDDFAKALKRASLQRQLDGREPSTLQDILEEAIEPWLREHQYLP